MKLVFRLSEKQMKNARAAMEDSTQAYQEVRQNYCFENVQDMNGEAAIGYQHGNGISYSVWQGNILGWIRLDAGRQFKNVSVELRANHLVVIGEREVIGKKSILDKLTKVLGVSWRAVVPETYEDEQSDKLFWWETTEHYYQWRADWGLYFDWLKSHIDPDKGIDKFDGRFHHENECLKLLKVGKLTEARQRYPNIVDQILEIA